MTYRWLIAPLILAMACTANTGSDSQRSAVTPNGPQPTDEHPEDDFGENPNENPGENPDGGTTQPPPGGSCVAASSGWRAMAPSPVALTEFHFAEWSGTEMLLLGTARTCGASGCTFTTHALAYNPATNAWRSLPTPGVDVNYLRLSTFGDGRWFLWGHVADPLNPRMSGFMFNVATNSWSDIPAAPVGSRLMGTGVYATTTHELVLWGGTTRDDEGNYTSYRDGAAYNPATNTWRMIADAPFEGSRATAMWVSGKMLVLFPSNSIADEGVYPQPLAATYDPATNTWMSLPTPTFGARIGAHEHVIGPSGAYGAVYRGDRAFEDGDYPDLKDGGYWDSTGARWVNIPAVPFSGFDRSRRIGMASWSGNGKLFVWGGLSYSLEDDLGSTYHRDGAVFDPLSGTWTHLEPGGPSERYLALAVWTGCDAIVYGGQSTGAPFVRNDGMIYRP